MRARRAAGLLVALLLLFPAFARVLQASELAEAQPGDTVRVLTTSPAEDAARPSPPSERNPQATRTVQGTLVELDEETITVLQTRLLRNEPIRLPRTAIARLEVARGSTRGRNALIGAGIGAVLGLVGGAVERNQCEKRGDWLCDTALALPVLTAPVGALVGLLTGGERWVEATPAPGRVSVAATPQGVRVVWSVSF